MADLQESPFAVSDDLFWKDYWERKQIVETWEAQEAQRPSATWRTGGGECQLCLCETSGENLCGKCAGIVDPAERMSW